MRSRPFPPWPVFDRDEIGVASSVLASGKVNYWTGGECQAFEQEIAAISPKLVTELERALNDHELVKLRARVGDRDLRDEILDELAKATGSELVQRIGHVALYYRPRKEKPGILLPG